MRDTPKCYLEVYEDEELSVMEIFELYLKQVKKVNIGGRQFLMLPDILIESSRIEAVEATDPLPNNSNGSDYRIHAIGYKIDLQIEPVAIKRQQIPQPPQSK